MKNKTRQQQQQNLSSNNIAWRTIATYVDMDTGEIIERARAHNKNFYARIETKRTVKFNKTRTGGTIFIESRCYPSRQLRIF